MRPTPSVIGSMRTKTRLSAGSRRSSTARMRPSFPRSHQTGVTAWITVPARIPPA